MGTVVGVIVLALGGGVELAGFIAVVAGFCWAAYLHGQPASEQTDSTPSTTTWADWDDFLDSYQWRSLRYKVLRDRGARCECCGATPDDGVKMNVDHIRPRRDFPELALDEGNLQVLCEECNHGKGNWDRTDWRRR
jgi:5-methylcytosine-specific restriction endonuclease McrA